MSRNTRASQPRKAPAPIAPPSPTLSQPPLPPASVRSSRSAGRWARPTTNADKEKLQREYGVLFDSVNKLKDTVIASDERSQKVAGRAFDAGLVSSVSSLIALYNSL